MNQLWRRQESDEWAEGRMLTTEIFSLFQYMGTDTMIAVFIDAAQNAQVGRSRKFLVAVLGAIVDSLNEDATADNWRTFFRKVFHPDMEYLASVYMESVAYRWRRDRPEWAKWLTVDEYGGANWWEVKPLQGRQGHWAARDTDSRLAYIGQVYHKMVLEQGARSLAIWHAMIMKIGAK